MKLLTATLLVLIGSALGRLNFGDVDFEKHMQHFTNNRYPIERDMQYRQEVQEYIKSQFTHYGLNVEEQNFTTLVNSNPKGFSYDEINVTGTNLIGVYRAETTNPGAVIVVGADYDTNGIDDPLFRNGAGMAALLEVARLYTFNSKWSGRLIANYTTVFVAFDINTRYHEFSAGMPGGQHFVTEWLLPFLNYDVVNFGGAVILDSIMNVNYDNDSQQAEEFRELSEETYNRIQNGGKKGDFLAMVSTTDQASTDLKDKFSGSYMRDRKRRPFRLEDIQLKSGVNFENVREFTKTETIHFWTFNQNGTGTILPALLLTDTTKYRQRPDSACSDMCRPKDLLTEQRVEFMNATVNGLTHFLIKRQNTLLPEHNGSRWSSLPSALMTGLMLLLVRLYH